MPLCGHSESHGHRVVPARLSLPVASDFSPVVPVGPTNRRPVEIDAASQSLDIRFRGVLLHPSSDFAHCIDSEEESCMRLRRPPFPLMMLACLVAMPLAVLPQGGPADGAGGIPGVLKSTPVIVGPKIPGPFGTATKQPSVIANVSISGTQALRSTVQGLTSLSEGIDEFNLILQKTELSAMAQVSLQPGAEVISVTFPGVKPDFTYERTTGSLTAIIQGPIATGTLQIRYFLAGGPISQETPADLTNPPSNVAAPGSSAWVHGHIKTDFTNWNAPVAGIKVELHKDDWPWYTYLATTYTDSSGLYDFGYIDLSSTGNTLRLRIYVEGWSSGGTGWKERVVVRNAANYDYEISGDATHTYAPDDTYYLDLASNWMDPNSDFDDGLHAYYSSWQEFSYLRDNFGFVTSERGLSTLHLFATATNSDGYDINIESATYAYNHLITQHEFSHNVMYQTYGDHFAEYYSGCSAYANNHQDYNYWGTGHVTADPDTHGGPCTNDAVTEGWAEFVPASIQNDAAWPVGDGRGGVAYYEQLSNGYGELNEFGLAGALWDLWKTPGQSASAMFGYIWQVTQLDRPGRVESVYLSFVSRYPSLTAAADTAFQNHFVLVSSLSSSLSSSSVVRGSSISISGTLWPLPHIGRTVTVYIAPAGSGSWSVLASTTTRADSTYVVSATINVNPGSYDVKVSWTGDRYPTSDPRPYSGHNPSNSPNQQLQVNSQTMTVITTKTLTETSTSYSYRTTTTTSTSYTGTTTTTSTIPTVTTVALVPLTITSTEQSTQLLTSVLTTTTTDYTSTTTLTSTIPTTVALVVSTVTSVVQSIQYLTSILSTTTTSYTSTQTSTSTVVVPTTVVLVPLTITSTEQSTQLLTSFFTTTTTSYTSTTTSTSTIPTVTTVVLVPLTVTSTEQSTQLLTSVLTTTTTSYTSTTTSTSTSVVYTTATESPGGAGPAGAGASSPLAYLGFLSLVAVAVGRRVTAGKGGRILRLRSLMERRSRTE